MSFEHGTRLTFASLDRDSDTLAGNLTALGVAPGDRVMAVLKNRQELMLTMIATLKTDGLVILDAKDGTTVAFEKWETSYRTNSTTPIVKVEDPEFYRNCEFRHNLQLGQVYL